MREPVARPGEQLLLRDRPPGLALHDRLDPLSHLLVGDTDHRDIGNLGVLDEQRLDLSGIHVHATLEDEVGATVRQVEEPVCVDVPHVSQRAPAAVVVRVRGLGRVVVVGELRRALEPDTAPIADCPTDPLWLSQVALSMAKKQLPSLPA